MLYYMQQNGKQHKAKTKYICSNGNPTCLVLGPNPKYFMPMTVAKQFIDSASTDNVRPIVPDFTCYYRCFVVPHLETQQHDGVL